jgi:hypothetical protein
VRVCDGEIVTGVLPPVAKYPAPLTATWETATWELPVLVTLTFCEGEDVPVVTLPKLRLAGLTARAYVAAIPEPVRVTGMAEVDALLTMEMVPETAPTAAGRKLAVIVARCPALTFKGSENPLKANAVEPVAVTCVMLKAADPELVTINTCDSLVPTGSFPKLRELELS